MIDQFSKPEFEAVLPVRKDNGAQLWECLGQKEGEWVYFIRVDSKAGVIVRSSIHGDGIAAGTGKDSIRVWLVDNDHKPLGSKVSRWIARTNGWDVRMLDEIRTLWGWRKQAGDCSCGLPLGIFVTKTKKVFCNCKKCSPIINDWSKVKWLRN